jgi:hypothetical protein
MTQNCNCHGSGGQYSQTVAAIIERPRYSPGLILEDSDLTSAVDYTQSLSRLLFRNLFGCGVICGLNVKIDTDCGLNVTVSPGLALDGCGDPLQLPAPVTIAFDKKKADQISKDGSVFWVTLCGKEKLCQPRALVCEADDYDGVTQATRIRSLSELSISFEKPECICGCPDPDQKPGAAQGTSASAAAGPVSGRDTCVDDHATRVDCAEDCGCGTACDCGCCVLLARVSFAVGKESPDGKWTVQHKGVRRLVRPAMVADRDPFAPPATTDEAIQAPPKSAEKTVAPPVRLEPTLEPTAVAVGEAATPPEDGKDPVSPA